MQKNAKTTFEKDVGVLIHSTLKPRDQCVKAAKKANQVLGQMSRALHFRDKQTFVRLYIQYCRPHLEYAVQAWNPWYQGDIDVIENVQKRALKMVAPFAYLKPWVPCSIMQFVIIAPCRSWDRNNQIPHQ